MNAHTREGSAVPVSYKTPAYLLIAKYGKGRAVDRGRQKTMLKKKQSFTIVEMDIS